MTKITGKILQWEVQKLSSLVGKFRVINTTPEKWKSAREMLVSLRPLLAFFEEYVEQHER